jgi:hypothetical protein
MHALQQGDKDHRGVREVRILRREDTAQVQAQPAEGDNDRLNRFLGTRGQAAIKIKGIAQPSALEGKGR